MEVTVMALGARGRHCVSSAEPASDAEGARGCAGPGCLWPQPPAHPASPPAHASSSCQSLKFLNEDSDRWLFLFQYWKEQSVNISFEYIQIRPCARASCKPGFPMYFGFLLMASMCPESRVDSPMGTLEPQQGLLFRGKQV